MKEPNVAHILLPDRPNPVRGVVVWASTEKEVKSDFAGSVCIEIREVVVIKIWEEVDSMELEFYLHLSPICGISIYHPFTKAPIYHWDRINLTSIAHPEIGDYWELHFEYKGDKSGKVNQTIYNYKYGSNEQT